MMKIDKAKLDDCVAKMDAVVARTDPPVSEKQRRAMHAAASGNSTLGIPKKVGQEFAEADPGGKLPKSKSDGGPGSGPPPQNGSTPKGFVRGIGGKLIPKRSGSPKKAPSGQRREANKYNREQAKN